MMVPSFAEMVPKMTELAGALRMSLLKMLLAMVIAFAPDIRIMPMAPPDAVAAAQIVVVILF